MFSNFKCNDFEKNGKYDCKVEIDWLDGTTSKLDSLFHETMISIIDVDRSNVLNQSLTSHASNKSSTHVNNVHQLKFPTRS